MLASLMPVKPILEKRTLEAATLAQVTPEMQTVHRMLLVAVVEPEQTATRNSPVLAATRAQLHVLQTDQALGALQTQFA